LNDEDTILVTVVVIETSANFSITDTIGCPPLLVNHTDLSITSIGSISEWYWTFPDGDFSYLPNPSHTYYTSIYGTTTLEVTTDFGCSSTISIETNITVIPAPLAEFSYTPEDPTLEDELNFLDESLDPVTWEWSFGDDNYSILQNPTHSYSEIGTYNVMLKVSNEYCSDSIIKSLTIDEVVVGDVGVGDVIVGDVIEDDTIVDVIIPDEIIPIEIIPKETLPKEDLLFYIPNAFTPSSGDINNVFSPIFTSGYNPYNYHLTLFNREGQIIFESYDANFGWNGNYGYEPVSTGVFIWQVEFQLEDSSKKEVHRGHVTLIR
jgi:gliding motility-associated-like protein